MEEEEEENEEHENHENGAKMFQEHEHQVFHGLYQENWPNTLNFTAELASENTFTQCPRFEQIRQEDFNKSVSKLKPNRGKTDVIEVHGGPIVRSAGRKDRYSKVCTAKGTKDRRVRLSPNTAIQFYDVQDRLGYDRPSTAIDWLLKEAKPAIDALDDSTNAVFLNSNHHLHSSHCLQAHPTSHIHTNPHGSLGSENITQEAGSLSTSLQNYQNGHFSTSSTSYSQISSGMETFGRFFSWDANYSSLCNEKENEELLFNSLPLE